MERKCLQCGDEIQGRSDKKFCSDYCRSAYNYGTKFENYSYIKKVNNILRKNYRILTELAPNGKAKVSRTKMIDLGYNFMFHTHTYTNKNGITYYYVYDKGYLPIENEFLALMDKPDYID